MAIEESSFDYNDTQSNGSSKIPPVAIVLLVLVACLIGATIYLYLDLRSAKAELAQRLQTHEEQLAQLEGNVNRASRQVDTQVSEIKGVIESAEKELAAKTQSVEQKVIGRTQTLAKELEATQSRHQAALSEVGGELQQLKQTASKTEGAVGSLAGEVGVVKQDVDKTRQELEKTIAELKTVRGDLGVQSGLIATNANELQALRQLGEKNYYEFDLTKTKQPQRVGSISIKLKGADQKRNKFTIELWADDRRVEKKDKTLLEPVQFYVQGSRIPYELVVNKLEKNRIIGYLATPKTEPQRAAAQTGGGSQ
jgi:chromosome segregation ATPase